MIAALIALNVLAGLFLIGVVLLQSGKGADMGAAFGGSSTTVFGASGAGNLLTKITAGTATVFLATSLLLAVMSSRDQSVFANAPEPEAAVPAVPDGLPNSGLDPNAAAEARGQEPIVNDEAPTPDETGGAGGGPASSDTSNDLGPAGAAGGPASSDAAKDPVAANSNRESDTGAPGRDLLGNPVIPMPGEAPRTGEAVPAPTGDAVPAPTGGAVNNATGGTPTNPTGAVPSNPTGAPPANATGAVPAPTTAPAGPSGGR